MSIRPLSFFMRFVLTAVLAGAGIACDDATDSTPGSDAGAPDSGIGSDGGGADGGVPATIPTGSEWLDHLQNDILPFYTSPEALGTPVGAFPTWRCVNGDVATVAAPCEFATVAGDDWIGPYFAAQQQYVRMRSRQTFLYGIAYNLTGDEQLFEYHLAGVRWLREHGLDPAGGAYTYYEGDVPGPAAAERTSQDQAYAVLALAMNYYLTRDPAALHDLVELEAYIFDTYWDDTNEMVRWKQDLQVDPPARDKNFQLVGALDQLNAYMVLALPLLPDGAAKVRWEADLRKAVVSMKDLFHDADYGIFWGEYNSAADQGFGEHTDFGHTVKAYWMTYLAGHLLAEPSWVDFGRQGMSLTLDRAYITDQTAWPDTSTWGGWNYDKPYYLGSWAGQFTGNDVAGMPAGQVPHEIYPAAEWWKFAELDQTAATLALEDLSDPTYLGYLATAYPKWFDLMVDHEHPGVFAWMQRCVANAGGCAADGKDVKFGKGNLWKGGFHEAEHTMISYLTSQAFRGQPAELYFAFRKTDAVNRVTKPYLFNGSSTDEVTAFTSHAAYDRVRAVFSTITP